MSPVYFYKKNEKHSLIRSVPSDLKHRLNKKIEVPLHTNSKIKVAESAAALSDSLERHWDTSWMEMVYSRELGLAVKGINHKPKRSKLTLTGALSLYQRVMGTNKKKLFFKASGKNLWYLIDCLGYKNLDEITSKDAGYYRDYLFDSGMFSSSINGILLTIRAIINLSI